MLRDPTQLNSRIRISRRRLIQAREQPLTQVGSLIGSLIGSLLGSPSSLRRILTISGGRRPCGRKVIYHERRRLDLKRRGRARPCRRAVTLQGTSVTPSSAKRGLLVTRQSFIQAEKRGELTKLRANRSAGQALRKGISGSGACISVGLRRGRESMAATVVGVRALG
jgi:hypothetical protein